VIVRAASIVGLAASLAGCATMPPPPPGVLPIEAARFACADGTSFTALFDPDGDAATLTFQRFDRDDPDALEQDRRFRVALTAQRVGSGFWYAGGGWSLRGKGAAATLARPDGRTAECRAGGAPSPAI